MAASAPRRSVWTPPRDQYLAVGPLAGVVRQGWTLTPAAVNDYDLAADLVRSAGTLAADMLAGS